ASRTPQPTLVPVGDSALLVRFGTTLTNEANLAAISFARQLENEPVPGVLEIAPNLVSVLLRYDAEVTGFNQLAGEVRLRLFGFQSELVSSAARTIDVDFSGPDLREVADLLGMAEDAFIEAHNQSTLRVLTTGFAPGFVYCGLHPKELLVPRRTKLRGSVPAGSILFAAGQTAIAATEMPTGWHVIGSTAFRNFHSNATPPTMLNAGEAIQFRAAP
ncbi:MAG: carboxyltransferase domain-containing protein, partial [Proteobacteria bacterium]